MSKVNLSYVTVQTEKDPVYLLNQLWFDNYNSLLRFGEWLAVMNEEDSFSVVELKDNDLVTASEVMLESYDQEEPNEDPYEYPQD